MLQLLPRLFQPGEMVVKRGSLIRLQYLQGERNRAVLITGKESLKRTGTLTKIEAFLKKAKMDVTLIDGVSGDPTIQVVEEITERLWDLEPDWIIAVGGGAVMDCAKLARVLYENPSLTIHGMIKPFTPTCLDKHCKLALVPTTSGSGSEMSHAAVVTDTEAGKKIPIVNEAFLPELVIQDATLTVHMSPELTAYTALDAFTHAVEAYCSRTANLMTNAYCVTAGRMIANNLVTAIAEPRNIDARENLLYASMFAGIAQNLASVGGVHALAHALGVQTGIPHGHANAIFLPKVLTFNSQRSSRPAQFSDETGFGELENLTD